MEIGEETSNDEIGEIYFAFFRETDESAGFVFSGYISLETRESATTSLRTFSMSWPSTESGKSGVTNRDVNVIHGISLTRAKVGTRKFHELTREQVQVRAIFSPLASLRNANFNRSMMINKASIFSHANFYARFHLPVSII